LLQRGLFGELSRGDNGRPPLEGTTSSAKTLPESTTDAADRQTPSTICRAIIAVGFPSPQEARSAQVTAPDGFSHKLISVNCITKTSA